MSCLELNITMKKLQSAVINKKLNYLVIGEKPTNKKVIKAKDLNINIISQDELIKMLNKTS